MSAIPNSPVLPGLVLRLAAWWLSTLVAWIGFAEETNVVGPRTGFRLQAQQDYLARQADYHSAPTNAALACAFARSCFGRAEYSTNAAERAALAEQGIAACRAVLKLHSNSAPARLYLAMNLGQLARTKTLGALPIVDEMEFQFQSARRLDEHLDRAAPDRYLGVLYREAPAIVSVGDRAKSRRHLLRAVQLEPDFPVHRLNLVESLVVWGEKSEARRQLRQLEARLPAARTNFAGADWRAEWMDWDQRLAKARRALPD